MFRSDLHKHRHSTDDLNDYATQVRSSLRLISIKTQIARHGKCLWNSIKRFSGAIRYYFIMSSLLSRRNHDGAWNANSEEEEFRWLLFNALFFRKVMEQEVHSIVKLERHQPSKTSGRIDWVRNETRKIEWKNIERSRKQKRRKKNWPNYSCRFSFFLFSTLIFYNSRSSLSLSSYDERRMWCMAGERRSRKVELKEEKKEKEEKKRFQNGMQCNFAAG